MGTLRNVALLALALQLVPAFAVGDGAQRFDSPQGAVAALVEAVRSDKLRQLRGILGPGAERLLHSGDAAEDALGRRKFIAAFDEAHSIVLQGSDESQAELQIGRAAWPLPIPLARDADGRWHFNAAAGAAEVLARRIGQNELSAMQVCLAIVDAEREYAMRHAAPTAPGEYTRRFRSSPGQHDGLYWPTPPGAEPSPLGPLLTAASREGYAKARPGGRLPYQGYFYKLLTAQGPDAPGGAYDYVVQGKLLGGIAVMAYPARYGASGVKSFIVSQNRVLYEKDLGPDTATLAHATRVFNPDAAWQELPVADYGQAPLPP